MINVLRRIFAPAATDGSAKQNTSSPHDVRVAVFALCVEMARIDHTFTQQELDTLLRILKDKYNLSDELANALLTEADKELEESVDLWQFARDINTNYTTPEKIEILEILWRIVYVDGKMDEHEHYLMNKLSNLLGLTHKQMIEAKLKILGKGQSKH